jgi:hypothetical protein
VAGPLAARCEAAGCSRVWSLRSTPPGGWRVFRDGRRRCWEKWKSDVANHTATYGLMDLLPFHFTSSPWPIDLDPVCRALASGHLSNPPSIPHQKPPIYTPNALFFESPSRKEPPIPHPDPRSRDYHIHPVTLPVTHPSAMASRHPTGEVGTGTSSGRGGVA